jgi:hypothetical protein
VFANALTGPVRDEGPVRLSAPFASPARIVNSFSMMVSIRRFTSGFRRDNRRDPAIKTLVMCASVSILTADMVDEFYRRPAVLAEPRLGAV